MSTTVKAGRVPGMIVELVLNGAMFTVFQVMQLAAAEIGRKKGLGGPAFPVNRGEYNAGGRNSVDIPQLNGRMLAEKQGERWINIAWDTPVKNDDIVLVVPKIQGNQFGVSVGRVPGSPDYVAIYGPEDAEGGRNAGTIAAALEAVGIALLVGEQVYVNDTLASLTTRLDEGDAVTVKQAPPAVAAPVAPSTPEPETSTPDESSELKSYRERAETHRKEAVRLDEAADRLEQAIDALTGACNELRNLGFDPVDFFGQEEDE